MAGLVWDERSMHGAQALTTEKATARTKSYLRALGVLEGCSAPQQGHLTGRRTRVQAGAVTGGWPAQLPCPMAKVFTQLPPEVQAQSQCRLHTVHLPLREPRCLLMAVSIWLI